MMDMDRQQKSVSRRELLRGTAAAAAFMIVPSHVLAGAAGQRPSDKLNLAAIGIGNMGSGNISQCHTENFVALCDVDDNYAKHVFDKFPNAGKYKDFRVMLDKEDKNIDGVVIATPDHTHYVVAMACLQHRKHIYLQKPLAHSIAEVRKLTETARAAKVQTQMGNQGHSSDEIRMLYEWIADDAIGPVREVYAWSDRPVGGDPWSDFPLMARPKRRRPCRLPWIGTCGWARLRIVLTIRSTARCAGVAGGISAREPWATWARTSWTRRSGRSSWAIRPVSRRRRHTISRKWRPRPTRGPQSFAMSSPPGATCHR